MYWRVALLVLLIASVPNAKAEPADERAGWVDHATVLGSC